MIKSGHGDKEASPLCVPVHVSHRMDTTVSIQSADQGGRRVSDDQDGRDSEEIPGDRVRATKYPAGPYPPGGVLPSKIQHIEGGSDHKTEYGKALWEKFDFIRERYYGRGRIWSAGYFVSTVGLDEQTIMRYVKYQEKEDLGQAKLALD